MDGQIATKARAWVLAFCQSPVAFSPAQAMSALTGSAWPRRAACAGALLASLGLTGCQSGPGRLSLARPKIPAEAVAVAPPSQQGAWTDATAVAEQHQSRRPTLPKLFVRKRPTAGPTQTPALALGTSQRAQRETPVAAATAGSPVATAAIPTAQNPPSTGRGKPSGAASSSVPANSTDHAIQQVSHSALAEADTVASVTDLSAPAKTRSAVPAQLPASFLDEARKAPELALAGSQLAASGRLEAQPGLDAAQARQSLYAVDAETPPVMLLTGGTMTVAYQAGKSGLIVPAGAQETPWLTMDLAAADPVPPVKATAQEGKIVAKPRAASLLSRSAAAGGDGLTTQATASELVETINPPARLPNGSAGQTVSSSEKLVPIEDNSGVFPPSSSTGNPRIVYVESAAPQVSQITPNGEEVYLDMEPIPTAADPFAEPIEGGEVIVVAEEVEWELDYGVDADDPNSFLDNVVFRTGASYLSYPQVDAGWGAYFGLDSSWQAADGLPFFVHGGVGTEWYENGDWPLAFSIGVSKLALTEPETFFDRVIVGTTYDGFFDHQSVSATNNPLGDPNQRGLFDDDMYVDQIRALFGLALTPHLDAGVWGTMSLQRANGGTTRATQISATGPRTPVRFNLTARLSDRYAGYVGVDVPNTNLYMIMSAGYEEDRDGFFSEVEGTMPLTSNISLVGGGGYTDLGRWDAYVALELSLARNPKRTTWDYLTSYTVSSTDAQYVTTTTTAADEPTVGMAGDTVSSDGGSAAALGTPVTVVGGGSLSAPNRYRGGFASGNYRGALRTPTPARMRRWIHVGTESASVNGQNLTPIPPGPNVDPPVFICDEEVPVRANTPRYPSRLQP